MISRNAEIQTAHTWTQLTITAQCCVLAELSSNKLPKESFCVHKSEIFPLRKYLILRLLFPVPSLTRGTVNSLGFSSSISLVHVILSQSLMIPAECLKSSLRPNTSEHLHCRGLPAKVRHLSPVILSSSNGTEVRPLFRRWISSSAGI